MAVYRTNFYDPITLPLANITESIDMDIRKSYYGGIVDVYKPQLKDGYYYDVNSLYSYAMTMDMPIGLPAYIKGDINLDTFYGFQYVKVTSPNDMKIPFLPRKIEGKQLVALGCWEGWYYSEELKHAVKLGYIIEVQGGQWNSCCKLGWFKW